MIVAKWPIADRARDLEKAKGYQREEAKEKDTRKQTEPKPCETDDTCK
jgi:hypothetical protein